ncbi:glycosyltransferase family 4 protein [uncultured Sphingomonas sp.]|uniref:glycosyltransferase family 4 protein n=1 Tax=uncultured Sphingomonas sp. TaxID=158754 RepID=UPI0035CA5184
MLTLLSVSYPLAPVTADPAGGAEQVLAQLDRALVAAGHRSIVIAPDGSAVAGELISLPRVPAVIGDADRTAAHGATRDAIAGVLARERVDLVHLHGIDFPDYLPASGVPALATLHMPPDWYAEGALTPTRPRTFLSPVSHHQAGRAPATARLLDPIPNGVDEDAYRPGVSRGDFAVVLGRVAPEKGFHDAADAAREAGVPLIAAGKLFPYAAHLRYFIEQVRPRLDRWRRYIGPVAGAQKRRLLQRARCLLIPSTAPETSSLVAMEALASGTPVIAYRAGALPEIVDDGVTGFVVDDVAGMAAAIGRIDAIDPAACRRAACERFSLRRTTAAYLDLYHRLAA